MLHPFKTALILLLMIPGCSENSSFHPERIRCLERLVEHLKIYSAQDQKGPLVLKRMGRDYDGGYIIAEKSLRSADALLGYGLADDISFEEAFCDLYKKPAYGFDGGAAPIASQNKLFTFFRESIASDRFLYRTQTSSGKISTFTEQIARLNLNKKKCSLKWT